LESAVAGVVYHWRHGWIPLDHTAPLSKAKGNHEAAKRMLADAKNTKGIETKAHLGHAIKDLPNMPEPHRAEAAKHIKAAAERHGIELPGRKSPKYRPAKRTGSGAWADGRTYPDRPDGQGKMGYILSQQGWDGPISELDDHAFDEVARRSAHPVVFHGVRSVGSVDADVMLRDFVDDDSPWISKGVDGPLWYTSTSVSTANQYAGKAGRFAPRDDSDVSHVGASVAQLAFRPEARIIDIDSLELSGKLGRGLAETAAQLGYDAVRRPGPHPGEWYYLLMNRSAVVAKRLNR
jgi:hypothetical protein